MRIAVGEGVDGDSPRAIGAQGQRLSRIMQLNLRITAAGASPRPTIFGENAEIPSNLYDR